MKLYTKRIFTPQYEKKQTKYKSFILVDFEFQTKLIQKQTVLSSNAVPLRLDFLVAKSTPKVAMQIF